MKTLYLIVFLSLLAVVSCDEILNILAGLNLINLPANYQVVSTQNTPGSNSHESTTQYTLLIDGKTCELTLHIVMHHQFLLGSYPVPMVTKDTCGLSPV
ncbi:hypothetical protein ACF0H5_003770 [Mactra antiquata]